MDHETTTGICMDEETSEPFNTSVGMRQRCVRSPFLFALFFNHLHDSLSGSVNVKGKIIRVLLHADDIVMLAEQIQDDE